MRTALHAVVFAILLVACGGGGGSNNASSNGGGTYDAGLAACPANNQVFTTPPIALEQVLGWVPLGALNPPGHTFPTDHQYLYTTLFNTGGAASQATIPVVAPADIRITQLFRSSFGAGFDYSVFFQPCADLGARFGHVVTLAPEILAAAGPIDKFCQTYEPSPGQPTTLCQSAVFRFDVKAGQQIGTLGGGGSSTLDWWLQDRRIAPLHFTDPSRFSGFGAGGGFDEAHVVPATDYFTAAAAAQIAPKIGRFDGTVRRTTAPIGGTIAVDVDGTARGYWFNPSQPYPPESSHAALVPDHITPDTLQAFAIGPLALHETFAPQTSGVVNRAFESITPGATIYCYEPIERQNVILLQLVDATTLMIEVKAVPLGTCGQMAPWTFGAAAITFRR